MNKILLPILAMSLMATSQASAFTIWWKAHKPQQSRTEIVVKKTRSFFNHKLTTSTISAAIGAGLVLAWQKYKSQKSGGQQVFVTH